MASGKRQSVALPWRAARRDAETRRATAENFACMPHINTEHLAKTMNVGQGASSVAAQNVLP